MSRSIIDDVSSLSKQPGSGEYLEDPMNLQMMEDSWIHPDGVCSSSEHVNERFPFVLHIDNMIINSYHKYM